MDLPTLGTNPNSKQHRSATQEAEDLGNLRSPRRTVRDGLADGLKLQPEQQVLHLEKWTVCGHPADSPTRADSPATPGGQSGKPTPTETPQLNKSKQSDARTREEHDEQPIG
jgi:hypothetical protein